MWVVGKITKFGSERVVNVRFMGFLSSCIKTNLRPAQNPVTIREMFKFIALIFLTLYMYVKSDFLLQKACCANVFEIIISVKLTVYNVQTIYAHYIIFKFLSVTKVFFKLRLHRRDCLLATFSSVHNIKINNYCQYRLKLFSREH